MSHVTKLEAKNAEDQIKDLIALEAACKRMGLEFFQNQTRFKTYPGQPNICLHAIGLEGKKQATGTAGYEIGVVESSNFPGTFSLAYDPYGGALDRVCGKGLSNLRMRYKAEACRREAEQQGDMYSETVLPDGRIVAEIDTTMRLGV